MPSTNTLSSSPYLSSLSSERRFGLHYYPDTLHYREADLASWLPALQSLKTAWLVLHSELDRAIPEYFLHGLKQAGIEPIIHFQPSLDSMLDMREVRTLLQVYARWGLRYVIFYDRPNQRASWAATGWAQQDLVERFLDRFIPVASLAAQMGLTPVFAPLEPGGNYWDTAFLRTALQAIERRKQVHLLQNLALSAYAWSHSRSLDWGVGGPERWPQARPYLTPAGSQDQRSFRIFDWYQAVAQTVLHHPCPVILLQAGCPVDPRAALSGANPDPSEEETYTTNCLNIARLLSSDPVTQPPVMDPLIPGNPLEPVSSQVIACNFWLLSAGPSSPFHRQAWFQDQDQPRPVVAALREQLAQQLAARQALFTPDASRGDDRHPIHHYLLLPGFEWGIPDWYLEVIRPYVKKHRPTVGFSIAEAQLAVRVTVVGNSPSFSDEMLANLRQSGCQVEQINGDGTTIATLLSER